MNRKHAIVAAAVSAFIATGCSVTPSIKYSKIDASNPHALTPDQFDTYYLTGSKVRIELSADAVRTPAPEPQAPPAAQEHEQKGRMLGGTGHGAAPAPAPEPSLKPGDLVVTSTPVENRAFVFALTHDDPFWASTTVNINKIENTGLVKDIGTDLADYRIEYVNAAASVITRAAGGMLGDNKSAPTALDVKRLPVELDLVALLAKADDRNAKSIKLDDRTDIEIMLGEVPPDAEPLSDLTFPLSDSHYIYSSCRTLTVSVLLKGTKEPVSRTVKIADPNFIQRVALPKKGKITMHSECGVSVSSESQPKSENAALIQALATQGKAIADALSASNNGKKK